MTAAELPDDRAALSRRNRANRNRGVKAERDAATYLRGVGFPHCERAVRAGFAAGTHISPDRGDLAGIPGVTVSVKDADPERITRWLAELAAMTEGRPDLGILIHKRRGHADPAQWWAWLGLSELLALSELDARPGRAQVAAGPVRLELGHLVPLLRWAGYGA